MITASSLPMPSLPSGCWIACSTRASKMSPTRKMQFLLIAVTVLALGAGLTAGLLSARLPNHPNPSPDRAIERTLLVEELNLSPDQHTKMKQIWEAARTEAMRAYEDAQQLQKNRDERIF